MKKPGVKQGRDDAAVEAIIYELRRLNPTIEKSSWAVGNIKHSIKDLRAGLQQERTKPDLREMKEIIERLAQYARGLSGIENMPPLRSELKLDLEAPDLWMNAWFVELKHIADVLEQKREILRGVSRQHGPHKDDETKLCCAMAAHGLIDALVPPPQLAKTEGSAFYEITNWLWWAASGEEQSMKRICDYYIDHLKGKKPDIKGTVIHTELKV